MAQRQEYERMYVAAMLFAALILLANLYYFCHPVLRTAGITFAPLDYLVSALRRGGVFSTPLKSKGFAMLILVLCSLVRSGKGRKVDPGLLAAAGAVGLFLYLYPFRNPLFYLIATLSGGAALVWTSAMTGRIFAGFHEHGNDLKESFEQEGEPYPGEWSVVLPTKYYWRKAWHR